MIPHQFGFEVRLTMSRQLVQSEVCQTHEAMIETQERWRAALGERLVESVSRTTEDL
jgi:hypothetical protein